MALAFVFALLAQRVPRAVNDLDTDVLDRMQRREAYLREQMTRLLEEVEQSRMDVRPVHFFALQPWTIWALAVLLLFLLFCFFRIRYGKRQEKTRIQRLNEMQRNLERKLREPVCRGDPNDVTYMSRFDLEFSIWPLKARRETCKIVEQLMNELLSVCQMVPQSYFNPWLQPVIGVGVGFEGSGPEGSYNVYRLLVPLKAPPGHAFHLELGPKARKGVRNSCLRVELRCTCAREKLLRDMLCFLHHPEDQLRRQQMPSLLQTLCTDSYLDIEKTATWLQELVREAWVAMPQSATVQLELLPSTRFCKLKLTTASGEVLRIELLLGVQEGDSDTSVTLE